MGTIALPHQSTEARLPTRGAAPPDLAPGSPAELRRFAELQRGLAPMYRRVFADDAAPRTVVVVPSMTLDLEELTKLVGAPFYEERLLCLALLLRMPATRVVYVTSQPIPSHIVEYYLRLLPAETRRDAWRRLTMLSCHDDGCRPLTAKLLEQPALLARVRAALGDPESAHLTCFNVTALERTLAVRLGIPVYGCDPALLALGTKSGSRDVFMEAGVLAPPGYGHLHGEDEMVGALVALRLEHPSLTGAVVKLEEGFSGEGNAIFSYEGAPRSRELAAWVREQLPTRLQFVAPQESWPSFRAKFARMGGIVEAFVCGNETRSPSVQCRIDPVGEIQVVSTHDQLLGGATGQVFLGCTFPALPAGRDLLHDAGRRVAEVLASRGVVGRFGVDFMVTRTDDGAWRAHAIEINLRKGGTTHPYLTLQLLTGGAYDERAGEFRTASGRPCHYVASDNVTHPAYANLEPAHVLAATAREGIGYDRATERGVVFHLMGALSVHGKLGALAIGRTPADARALYDAAVALLDRESGRSGTRAVRGVDRPRPAVYGIASSSRTASSTVLTART